MNELTLCIVNEGDLYKRNCEIARLQPIARALEYRHVVQRYATEYVKRFDDVRPFTPMDISITVSELDAYYQRHIKEL